MSLSSRGPLAVLLGAALSVSLVTACGGETTQPGAGTNPLVGEPDAGDAGPSDDELPKGRAGAGGADPGSQQGSAAGGGPLPPAPGMGGRGGAAGQSTDSPGTPGCWCTRRPGFQTSTECTVGSNASHTETVGPQGGLITAQLSMIMGVAVTLEIPPGALLQDTAITITETSQPAPDGYVDWSPVYRFEPADLVFLKPVALRIPWENLSFIGNNPEHPIQVQWSTDGSTWAPLADSYVNAGFHNATTTRLGSAFSGFLKGDTFAHCP